VAPQLAVLSATFILVSAVAGASLAYLAGQARHFLSGERLKWIDIASGALLILAGLWLGWPKG
jgi:threonine/homoserine/homoserine lactone efflux protein